MSEQLLSAAEVYADYSVFDLNGHLFSNNNDEAANAIKCSTESFTAGAQWADPIGFAEWLLTPDCRAYRELGTFNWTMVDTGENVSTQQLFTIFKKQQQ